MHASQWEVELIIGQKEEDRVDEWLKDTKYPNQYILTEFRNFRIKKPHAPSSVSPSLLGSRQLGELPATGFKPFISCFSIQIDLRRQADSDREAGRKNLLEEVDFTI